MEREELVESGRLLVPEKVASEWARLIQQHVQNVLQTVIPLTVQQITKQVAAKP